MPKIISNSIISSSDHRDEQQGLHSYYCLCSEFILVIDMELGQLPRRETDNSIILTNATRMYKLHAIQTEAKIVKRGENLFEKQYRLHCPRCSLLIAYETTKHLKGGPYTYIVQGALNEIQGVPHDDWEQELPGTGPAAGSGKTGGEAEAEEDSGMEVELQIRADENQSAAAQARAFLAASMASSSSSS
ncbi:hypothetical protein BKA57DRAFT_538112 [Linnemannia elongata]|uniref:STEEP1 domain-containing protein n=1 Tax=Linnemannia elongata AG-77 TaxID=1314771 RepID=A0A197JUU3_9FUNG|nr:hypothetical protein BGZ91_004151 [Linnemannia elongata]OAQ28985.1 hypothetical protein K457DRAFT_1832738 [Linnemannia elongata AG-77]KAG0055342.1 hypothetical protein BGZ89_002375 [Linnemannia elongata]KAG0067041.1 hypothetical protein BGZ90_001165 [Linnemannia elongata]KAH7044160.1 hypothetical protein BKA57DRAFT_538112 [Linnemannia elongata]